MNKSLACQTNSITKITQWTLVSPEMQVLCSLAEQNINRQPNITLIMKWVHCAVYHP